MTTMTTAEVEAAAREAARVTANHARRTTVIRVPTRQRDAWQAYADLAITGWTTH